MYKKLNLKIRLTLIVFLFSLIIIESIISINSITKNIEDNYVTFSEEKIELTIANANFHFDTISSFCNQICKTEKIIEKVSNGSFSLNNFSNVPQSIIGITVYNLNGNSYSSNNISNVPTLERLKTNVDINEFFESNDKTCYITRTTAIATFYSGLNYDPNYGVISNITKVYDNDELSGYIIVDVRPLYLYTNVFDISDYYPGSISYIMCNDGYLKSTINSFNSIYLSESILNKVIISKDNKFFIITKYLDKIDASLIILVPKSEYTLKVLRIITPILIIDISFIAIIFIYSLRISRKITESLDSINNKIQRSNIKKLE